MKQIIADHTGGPDVLHYRETPDVSPGPGQVLLEVRRASVNFSDVMRRRGDFYPIPTRFPFVPGSEVAGTVVAIGAGVARDILGRRVCALVGDDASGGYATHALTRPEFCVPLPDSISDEHAAGFFVAGTTAYLMATRVASVQADQTVFIPGAAGAVGQYLIRIAKIRGARVFAAAATELRRDTARAAGADVVFDSRSSAIVDDIKKATDGRGVDVVFEATGNHGLEQAIAIAAPFSTVIVYGFASGTPARLNEDALRYWLSGPAPNITIVGFNVGGWLFERGQAVRESMEFLMGETAKGALALTTHVRALSDAAAVHRELESGNVLGKIVLAPN